MLFAKTFDELCDGFAGAIAIDSKGNVFHPKIHIKYGFIVLMEKRRSFLIKGWYKNT
jgi:hypothetical protein